VAAGGEVPLDDVADEVAPGFRDGCFGYTHDLVLLAHLCAPNLRLCAKSTAARQDGAIADGLNRSSELPLYGTPMPGTPLALKPPTTDELTDTA
jgi:hypothetical protein